MNMTGCDAKTCLFHNRKTRFYDVYTTHFVVKGTNTTIEAKLGFQTQFQLV